MERRCTLLPLCAPVVTYRCCTLNTIMQEGKTAKQVAKDAGHYLTIDEFYKTKEVVRLMISKVTTYNIITGLFPTPVLTYHLIVSLCHLWTFYITCRCVSTITCKYLCRFTTYNYNIILNRNT